ncbi:hypothetical protein ABVT39_005761 [Epinephelus coioides]
MWKVVAVLAVATQHVTGKTLKYQIHEEQKVGTVIARLKEDVADVLSKLPSSVSLRFRAMQRGSSSFLAVREQDGEISIRTKIDREKLCEKNLNCSIQFDVLTLPTEHLQLFHVEVEVLDINDNAPQFARAIIPIEISESAAVGARIPLDSATDPDVGENSLYTYALEPNNFFKIDIQSRTDGAKYAELVVLRELDREVRSAYELQYTASDRGVPPRTGSTLLKISVTFKINPDSGRLTLIRRVDYEAINSYDIDVQAQDMGPNSMPAHCKIQFTEAGHLVTVVRATDRDTGVNAELICSIISGNEEGFFIIDPRTCEIHANASLENFPHEYAELTVKVRDQGRESLSAKAALKITLYENMENHVQVMDQGESSLDVSLIIIISLGAICTMLLVIMVVFAARCNREKKDTRNSYNCRVAESTHQHHPKKPSRQIHKGDITLVPTVNGTLPIRAHHRSPSTTPPMDRAQMGNRQNHHSRQSLNSLGQYQPRPSFRGNKYSRSYRYALQDMDKFSLKDSGRGDSEAGDSDCDMGRESPVDRLLLGEGFSDLIHLEMHHRLHPAMRLCTDECRILGHSDQCWMPPLSSPASSDYRNNMYIPGEESSQQPQIDDDQSSVESERRKSFSTFGKESGSEEVGAGGVVAGGGSDACTAGGGAGSLLTEMNSVFQRLLPPNIDTYTECTETSPPSSSSTTERGSGRGGNIAGNHSNNAVPQDNRRGLLPGGKGPAYPPGVAAWAASTHYLNPGSGSVGTNHVPSSSSSSTSTSASTNGQLPHLKWLPAMEEIPENYEEDDFDGVFHQGHQGGKRSENRHEAGMDASELVHEINKMLQDVRQN